MRRRPRSTEGAFSITCGGVESTSSQSLGAAISKALTIGSRVQREGLREDEDCRSVYVRRLGEEVAARVDVKRDKILVHAFAPTR